MTEKQFARLEAERLERLSRYSALVKERETQQAIRDRAEVERRAQEKRDREEWERGRPEREARAARKWERIAADPRPPVGMFPRRVRVDLPASAETLVLAWYRHDLSNGRRRIFLVDGATGSTADCVEGLVRNGVLTRESRDTGSEEWTAEDDRLQLRVQNFLLSRGLRLRASRRPRGEGNHSPNRTRERAMPLSEMEGR